MAMFSLSALRGGRFTLFNPYPYPQFSVANSRSRKISFRAKAFRRFARYSQAQDRFSSRVQDSIENLPKLVEDIIQTSINTGPRGTLRLAQGIQAFIGVGGEWLADVSKVGIVKDIRESMPEEVDFYKEAANIDSFWNYLEAMGLTRQATAPNV